MTARAPFHVVIRAALAVLPLAALHGCASDNIMDDPLTAHRTDRLDITFRTGVLPVLYGNDCTNGSCHAFGTPGTADDVYASLLSANLIDVEDPSESLLLVKPLQGSFRQHGGGKQFESTTDPDYLTLLGWIESGAPNN